MEFNALICYTFYSAIAIIPRLGPTVVITPRLGETSSPYTLVICLAFEFKREFTFVTTSIYAIIYNCDTEKTSKVYLHCIVFLVHKKINYNLSKKKNFTFFNVRAHWTITKPLYTSAIFSKTFINIYSAIISYLAL